jgi:hypothetical protein
VEFKEHIRTSIGIAFQFSLIALSISIMIGLIVWRSSSFISHEQSPKINPITPEKYQEFGGFSHTVTTGILIDQFIDFDMVTNNFKFDGTIWFKFDPGAISLDSLSKFSFIKGTIVKKSDPDIRLIDDKMLVKYVIRVDFKSDLNYQDFPLDSHSIYLALINKFISPSEVLFESSRREFTVNANVSSSGWDLVDTSVTNGYIESALDPYDTRQNVQYPATLFTLDYSRNSIRYTLSIILPLALIFYLLLFSISLRLISAIAITAAGVTATLAYRFVIENLSPKTGFFMISDFLFFLFLAATIGIFIINVAEAAKPLSSTAKKICIILLHALIIAAAIYVIVW